MDSINIEDAEIIEELPLEEKKELTMEELENAYKKLIMDYVDQNPSVAATKAGRKALGLTLRPFVRSESKIRRNELCPCGSGRKYKNCCLKNDNF